MDKRPLPIAIVATDAPPRTAGRHCAALAALAGHVRVTLEHDTTRLQFLDLAVDVIDLPERLTGPDVPAFGVT